MTSSAKRTDRLLSLGFVLVTFGLLGLIDGTLRVGSHPSWPSPVIWAASAAVAAMFALAAAFRHDWAFRGVALFVAGGVAGMRGVGYMLAPSDRLGFNSAAVGAYVIVVGVLVVTWRIWARDDHPDYGYLPHFDAPTPPSDRWAPPDRGAA